MTFWIPDRDITLIDNRAAPSLFCDGAVVTTGRTLARMTLFVRRCEAGDDEADALVAARLAMPLQGWLWTLRATQRRRAPLAGLVDDEALRLH